MPRHEMFELTPVTAPPTGLLARFVEWARRSFTIPPATLQDPALRALFGGPPTSSGVIVNEQTALTIAAVWDAVQVIAGSIASLPLHLYKRLPEGGKERMTWSRTYKLLHDEPNPEMTAMVFRETLQAHVLLWGNAYAEIERSVSGEPLALWPITPDRVRPERAGGRGQLTYRVANSLLRDDDTILRAEDVLHVPGLGFDGTCGYSVIWKARESLGLMKASEKFGAEFFGKGARSGGVFQHPGKLGKEAHEHLKQSLQNLQAHEYAVLEEGMHLERWTIPPDDAQFLQTRTFQIAEVARWFNLPPHKLKDLSRSTYSNIEQQEIDFVVGTLRPWLVRWEQEINRKLVRPLERSQQFAEHLVDGLLRGDIQSRYNAYAVGRQWGWLSADDVREKENLNPLPDGQGAIYMIPTNMFPADKADEIQAPGSVPASPAAPAADDEANARVLAAAVETIRPDIARLEEAIRAAQVAGESTAAESMAAALERLRTEPVEVAGLADAVAEIRTATEAAMAAADAHQTAAQEALEARLAQAEAAQAESLAALREGAARTAQRVQDRLRGLGSGEQMRQARAGMIAAQRTLVQDAMRRVLHRETLAACRAAQSPDKLRAWMETFYARRQPMTDALLPALTMHVALAGSPELPVLRAERLVAEHCERSARELGALLLTDPEELGAAVEALTLRWESDRPGEVADLLMQEVMAHVE